MPDVLNMWSTLQDNDDYSRWTEDRVGINKGYPIFTWELDDNMYEKPYELWVNVVKESICMDGFCDEWAEWM